MADRKFDRYEISREIGRGGMATVFEAFDPRFKRKVALKVLPREFLHDPTFRGRFEREAQTIAALEHPAIVPVYDFGEVEGQPYLVMRYMSGGSLEEKLSGGAVSFEEVSRILTRIASALDRAHRAGVIHRDLKPANILFDGDNNPYLADFGIAKITEATSALTGSSIIGTPAYMSPEQAKGEDNIDGRSDVYALGVIVYHILSGVLPFDADTPMGLALKHITDPPPNILDTVPGLPSGMNAVIKKALAKDKAARYTTAKEFAEELAKTGSGIYATRNFEMETASFDEVVEPPQVDPVLSAEQIEKAPVFDEPKTVRATEPEPSRPVYQTPPPSQPYKNQPKKKSGMPLLGIGLGVGGLLLLGLVAVAAVVIFLIIPGLDTAEDPTRVPTANTAHLTRTSEALSQQQTDQVIYQQQTADAQQLQANQTATAEQFEQYAEATAAAATQMIFARSTEIFNLRQGWPGGYQFGFLADDGVWLTGEKDDEYMVGEISIQNGVYDWDVSAKQGMIYRSWYEDVSFSDFYTEVYVTMLDGSLTSSCYGLGFMMTVDDWYRIQICEDQNFNIYFRDTSGWDEIMGWTLAESLVPGETNKLAVYAHNNNFEFFVNDIAAAEFSDSRLTEGYIGILVEMSEGDYIHATFDDLLIDAP